MLALKLIIADMIVPRLNHLTSMLTLYKPFMYWKPAVESSKWVPRWYPKTLQFKYVFLQSIQGEHSSELHLLSHPPKILARMKKSPAVGHEPSMSSRICFTKTEWVEATGNPFRDCTRGCNNRAHICAQLSATDVTGKRFFERLY